MKLLSESSVGMGINKNLILNLLLILPIDSIPHRVAY